MEGKICIEGKAYPITKAALHLPAADESRLLYLYVEAEPHGGFALWELELRGLEEIDDLHGKRLHLRWPDEALEDDTLGTDATGAEDTTDLNYLQWDGRNYGYGEVQVDFTRVQERQYRVAVRCELIGEKGEAGTAQAEFLVTADEGDPFEE